MVIVMNGIINVYKDKGYTSHDAVARLRGITGQRHIGHTGTLDPDAEGVLPVCLGTATKVCELLTDKTKVYETVLVLGIDTDTQDISGNVTGLAGKDTLDALSDETILKTIYEFVCTYMQVPPMFSAVKVEGRKLYSFARQGVEVEREAREVTIDSIEVISKIEHATLQDELATAFDDCALRKCRNQKEQTEEGHWQRVPRFGMELMKEEMQRLPVIRLALRIGCTKGTYIRTLCSDIGKKLGCFGCMEKLLRTRVGEFTIDKAHTLAQLEAAKNENTLGEYVIATDACFTEYERLDVKEKYDNVLFNGNVMYFRHFVQYITEPPSPVRVYSSKGEFLALYEFDTNRNRYKPLKMFRDDTVNE